MENPLDRILADDYLDGLADRSVPDLRRARAECQTVENELSYVRRLVQGRHDIVTGEIDRRRSGGDPDDVHGLVERLPEILADRIRAPGPGRMVASLGPPEIGGPLFERLEAIAEAVDLDAPTALPDAVLAEAAAQLAEMEGEVSRNRRAMFDRIDAIEAELTRRYADGEANVDDLLAHPSD
jgi:hypothetical protein